MMMWSLEAMKAIRKVEQQEEPVVQYTDRPRSSSSSAKSASGILSSVSLLLSSLRKWGYSIFPTTLSAKLPDFVEDIRKSHRRRVNRHTAPIEQPRFVILGNTGSAAAAVEDFQKYGMGPHYLIKLRFSNYGSATTAQQLRLSNYGSATTAQQPRLSNPRLSNHGSATTAQQPN